MGCRQPKEVPASAQCVCSISSLSFVQTSATAPTDTDIHLQDWLSVLYIHSVDSTFVTSSELRIFYLKPGPFLVRLQWWLIMRIIKVLKSQLFKESFLILYLLNTGFLIPLCFPYPRIIWHFTVSVLLISSFSNCLCLNTSWSFWTLCFVLPFFFFSVW